MPAAKIRELTGRKVWDSYFKFTVVRNPFSKLVSAFYHLYRPNIKTSSRLVNLVSRPKYFPLLINKGDIYDFRNWILNGGCIIDRDKYIIDGEECLDYFIKYESIKEDIILINKKLGINSEEVSLPHFKSGIRNKGYKISDFYDSLTEERVRRIYAFEIERFGYGMP